MRILFYPVSLLLLLFISCVSQRAVWDGRVGTYTYDQAVQELGLPESEVKGPAGMRTAEWLVNPGSPGSFGAGSGGTLTMLDRYPSPAARSTPPTPSEYLSLTFTADDQLFAWDRIYRYAK